ncbi:hypothetical protein F2Q69_00046672 [Brassica cretica]|uniref:Uncharacterized protein n=1 Tax=Brassica cretica TaxID=69181 RepID=A0A8S9PQF8_BRACR|nr:hypothetical protein F2Q69_00046672 [Brassica cretica]
MRSSSRIVLSPAHMSATLWLNYSTKPELIAMFYTGYASTQPVTSRWQIRRLSLFHRS